VNYLEIKIETKATRSENSEATRNGPKICENNPLPLLETKRKNGHLFSLEHAKRIWFRFVSLQSEKKGFNRTRRTLGLASRMSIASTRWKDGRIG
jgi:hypothetical protein